MHTHFRLEPFTFTTLKNRYLNINLIYHSRIKSTFRISRTKGCYNSYNYSSSTLYLLTLSNSYNHSSKIRLWWYRTSLCRTSGHRSTWVPPVCLASSGRGRRTCRASREDSGSPASIHARSIYPFPFCGTVLWRFAVMGLWTAEWSPDHAREGIGKIANR